jgi:DNA mismatch endonuclease, patch repair protein
MSDGWVSTPASRGLKNRRNIDTEPELLLRKALHARGLRFRLHRKLAPRCTPDLVLPRYYIAVFVDGDFWHGCPEHGRRHFAGPNAERWTQKLARTRERDEQATRTAEQMGWRVVRFWECEIRADPQAVAGRVLELCKHH